MSNSYYSPTKRAGVGLFLWAVGNVGMSRQGPIELAVVANYLVDPDWLLSACPQLEELPCVQFIVHSRDNEQQELEKRFRELGLGREGRRVHVHAPLLVDQYGTHHTKMVHPQSHEFRLVL